MASPREISKAVAASVGPLDPPREVVGVIKSLAQQHGWAEAGFEDDFAERVRPAVCDNLLKQHDLHSDGYYIAFMLFGLENQFIAGRYRADPNDESRVAVAKFRRAQIIDILAAIDALSPSEFELLCQKLPELMEGERQAYKPESNDQGIDFFSRVRFGSLVSRSVLGLGRERQMNAWIVGQAKHYKRTTVGTKEIRELIGALELARAKVFSSDSDPLENLSIKLCEPVFYCFFSSGQFTAGSKKLMNKAGVIYLEGFDIAQFLADHNAGFDGPNFDQSRFKAWVTA